MSDCLPCMNAQSESSGSFQHALVHGPSSRTLAEKPQSDAISGPTHTIPSSHAVDSLGPVATMSGGHSQFSVSLMSGNNRLANAYAEAAPNSLGAQVATVQPSKSTSGMLPPSNALTASCAVAERNLALPNFNDSTGAFGTTHTECTTHAPLLSAQGGQDSRTVSLTSVGATTTCAQAIEKEKRVLEETLDLLVATGTPFLLQYVMEGPVRWKLGSRGAVQYARSRLTGEKVRSACQCSPILSNTRHTAHSLSALVLIPQLITKMMQDLRCFGSAGFHVSRAAAACMCRWRSSSSWTAMPSGARRLPLLCRSCATAWTPSL